MLILRFRGGLGNQMFQYAFYRSAQQRGVEIQADITAYDYDEKRQFVLKDFPYTNLNYISKEKFNQIFEKYCNRRLEQKVINKLFPKTDQYFKESDESKYDESIFLLSNKIIDGYFQNENYFANIRDIILQELRFPEVKDMKFRELCEQIKQDVTSVSIHIRRGDYLELESLYGGICTSEYYQNAIKYMKDTVGVTNYYVLSDDIEWTRQHIKMEHAIYIDKAEYNQYEDWYDMYLMSICHHNIIANSSFSWWGAWLNEHMDKIVVKPRKWNNKSSMIGLCCSGWIEI